MWKIIAVEEGGGPCNTDCPYYAEHGWVRDLKGLPVKTHCRGTMEEIVIDCDKYKMKSIETMRVSEAKWREMEHTSGQKAKRIRKPYDPDHEEIHPVGYNWKHNRGKWNAEKSKDVKVLSC